MKIKINEINRDKKLLFQQNAPAKFMYNGKPIKLAPLGNEAVSEYTEECHSRWQPEYTQLKPSHIYANWFNPMIIRTLDFSTDVANNCRKWSLQWTNRKTIESDLILNESQPNASINIVRLLNSNTLDNPESSNKMVYLNTTADLRTNKWESLSPSPYVPCILLAPHVPFPPPPKQRKLNSKFLSYIFVFSCLPILHICNTYSFKDQKYDFQ